MSATVSGTSASLTVAVLDASGSTCASATGPAGTSVKTNVAAGTYTVTVTGTGKKTKYQLVVTYPS